jgi:hypothetical protein
MKTIFILFLVSTFAFQGTCGADETPTKQEFERMLSKKGSYEYLLVGRRLLRPIDDALLKRLAANPDESSEHDYVLSSWLLRIAANSNQQYLWLLKSKELRKEGGYDDILLAYDYNVNGDNKAFETLLERVRKSIEEAKEPSWGSAQYHALAAIDEWDLCRKALGSRYMSADGAGDDERHGFWLTRRYFFPDNKDFPKDYLAFCRDLEQLQSQAEQRGADQPATAQESKPEGEEKPQPKSEGRSR